MRRLAERQLIARVVSLITAAPQPRSRPPIEKPEDAVTNILDAHSAVIALGERLVDTLRQEGATGSGTAATLREALDLEDALSDVLTERRERRREALDRSLHRLREVRSTAELVVEVCEEAVLGCGMQRCLLSRVRDGVWSPWAVHDRSASSDAAAGRADRVALAVEDMALERTVLETSRPTVVRHAASDPRVHPAMRRLMGVGSYVVVPIAPNTTVVGLLHLDRGPDPRIADSDDEALAWAFAEGFGRVYERALMRERCEAQRALINSLAVQAAERAADVSTSVNLEPVRRDSDIEAPAPGEETAAGVADLERFTSRERDVALLMLQGLSNARIAEALILAPATVKSHVRQILRKVGAVNRVDAIARLTSTDGQSTDAVARAPRRRPGPATRV